MLVISSITMAPAPTATTGQSAHAIGNSPHASAQTKLTATLMPAPIPPTTAGC